MFTVETVSREDIDNWPVEKAGLPVRVVNCATSSGIHKVGELRELSDMMLLNFRSLGSKSINHIHAFFRLCSRIEQGKQAFKHIQEIFDIFLNENEFKVASLRYGFFRPDFHASRTYYKLQEIGNEEGLTRERVRQVEKNAKKKLNSYLCDLCLSPFFNHVRELIDAHDGIIAEDQLELIKDEPFLHGMNPASMFLLFSDLNPSAFIYYQHYFSTLKRQPLHKIEKAACKRLQNLAEPISIEALSEDLYADIQDDSFQPSRKALEILFDHIEAITATADRRYFISESATQHFLLEVMREMKRPVHFRAFMHSANEKLKPSSRKRAGYYLKQLKNHTGFVRTGYGFYDMVIDRPS